MNMRKIAIFSIIIAFFATVFGGISSVNAQFQFAGETKTPEIQVCRGNNCTLQAWLDQTKYALNKQVTDKKVSEYIQDVVVYLLGFVSLIGVIYIIWAGFNILIGNGDEKKLDNAKKTVLYVTLGMILMWLAYSIVQLIMHTLNKTAYHEWSKNYFAWNIIPSANAQQAGTFSESAMGSFAEYKSRVQVAIEELETELRIEKKVSTASIAKVKSLVQAASDRLPDKNPEDARVNDSAKRAVDMYLEMAARNPESTQTVGEAISKVANFINSAKIQAVNGSINANPTSGNAPLTVSFSAQNVIDPSGTIPPASSYIWWVRENGGVRRELGRWASLTQTFTNEGTYTVHLDVISASKNSKGRTDVLPLTASTNIEVKPKIGEITLLVNGINVSNLDSIKISPVIANQGLIFDATASRAIGNGRIMETKWEFGNGNSVSYKAAPSVERQIFATTGKFTANLSFTTNDGQTFTKQIELVIVDPAATIRTEKTTANVGEVVSFTAETQLGDLRNVEYLWTVQDENGRRDTKSGNGLTFSHTFTQIGSYIVTLTAKSPNGGIDTDSKTIIVESRAPIATLDAPQMLSSERPNTFIFDASRSYDADTNTREGLTYSWRLNDQPVTLDVVGDNTQASPARGALTFDKIGENTISVTVSNQYGKIATAEQKFRVTSVLAGNLIITPQVVKVGQQANFIAQSQNAQFFTWNMGDGTNKAGNDRTMQHTYKTTGTYNVNLTLQGSDTSNTTSISRKVYVTDMDSPFAVISFSNASSSAILEHGACEGKDAYILKRGEATNISALNSVNIDGNTSNLDYTWRYMGKVSTLSTLSENFRDLGCFPIELTVRSKTNGASHTTTEYIKLENQPPQITNISTTVDANKKDSQKLIVKATANGVADPDGVITSYIWYYTTESDKEPQSLQITQRPEMTFVLPNMTEKYYFGVILEDNDGARVNSTDILQSQAPLVIDNQNGNINMPLITLNIPSKTIKAGQAVTFSATAKTIMNTDITNKAQYSWDFDGDGKIDEKTNTPSVTHTYTKAGDYNIRVRVTNNGVSNTKFTTVHVRNELKASTAGYKLPDNKLFLLNTSQGVYDKAKWTIGSFTSNQLESVIIDYNDISQADANGSIGTLHVSGNDTDISTANISLRELETIETSGSGVAFQSFPRANNDTITISDPSQALKIAFYGNKATNYAIDTNLDMDGMGENMDGIPDNDIDNRNSSSYTDGSVFVINDFGQATTRERKMRITLYDGITPIATRTITVILDFISEIKPDQTAFANIEGAALTDFEKTKLEQLVTKIRALPDSERIVVMQKYNVLVENWGNNFEKAKNLVDLQRLINDQTTIEASQKAEFSQVIDELLIGDANTTNTVTVATTLIKNLLPPNSANYNDMVAKIDAIASHPTDREANRALGQELLVLIQQEPRENLSDDYKSIIRQQLQLIIANGDANAVQTTEAAKSSSSGGIMGVLMSILKVIGIILLVLTGLWLVAYIIYRINRKDGDSGFQDYIIDIFAHRNKEKSLQEMKPTIVVTPIVETKVEEKVVEIDPLKSYVPPTDPLASSTVTVTETTPVSTEAAMPDWLNPNANGNTTSASTTTESSPIEHSPIIEESTVANKTNTPEAIPQNNGGLPDWLSPVGATTPPVENVSENVDPLASPTVPTENTTDPLQANPEESGGLPDWLSPLPAEKTTSENEVKPTETSVPDWLGQAQKDEIAPSVPEPKAKEKTKENLPTWMQNPEEPTLESHQSETEATLPDWLSGGNSEENIKENTEENTTPKITDSADSEETPSLASIDENNFSYTNSKQEVNSEEKSKEVETANTELPDWITNIAENSAEPEVIPATPENPVREYEKIPDWLITSVSPEDDTSTKEEKSESNESTQDSVVVIKKSTSSRKNATNKKAVWETTTPKAKAAAKSETTKTPTPTEKPVSPDKTPPSDIPEWLK